MKKCQQCSKEAYFRCAKCEKAYYCTKVHQIQHWKADHKYSCERNDGDLQDVDSEKKKRLLLRKQYFENYRNKVFDLCLLDAKVMIPCQKSIKRITNSPIDKLEYGASVCLLIRTYILLQNQKKARLTLENYLRTNEQFLASSEDNPDLNNHSQEQKKIFQMKMNLLGTIANLCYVLEINCVKYYVLYVKNILSMFGENSVEGSNSYFMLGCYFAEEGLFKKAIACFNNSILGNGPLIGECYFNIGILESLRKNYNSALNMFENALRYRNEKYGEDSSEIAEVYENMGETFTEINDFVTALQQYEEAFKIRSNNIFSSQYSNLRGLIQNLYDKLCFFIRKEKHNLKKPTIFLHLKDKIRGDPAYGIVEKESNDDKMFEKQVDDLAPQNRKISPRHLSKYVNGYTEDKKKIHQKLIITNQLMDSFSPAELFLLSDLQNELSLCTTSYSMINTCKESKFMNKLPKQKLQILKQSNLNLFEQIYMESLRTSKK